MSSITNLTAQPTASQASTGQGALGQLSGDFDMFLNLLTTQMRNQDPLDPMDSSEYTQQLVQFSQVEQSIQQTGALNKILATLTTQDVAQASAFIGRKAEFDSATSGLGADPAQWGWQSDRPVASLTATITDSRGVTVATRELEGGARGTFEWDGSTAAGSKAPSGSYRLGLQGFDANGNPVDVAVTSIGIVDEVTLADGVVALGVNGATLPASSLLRISSKD